MTVVAKFKTHKARLPLRPENMVRGNADFNKQSFQVHDGHMHIKTILVAI